MAKLNNDSSENTFYIPKKVDSNFDGYNGLVTSLNRLLDCQYKSAIVDFTKNTWFDANLLPIVYAYVYKRKSISDIPIKCKFNKGFSSRNSIHDIMVRNGFSKECFGEIICPNNNETVIPFKKFKSDQTINFTKYITKELTRYFPRTEHRSNNPFVKCFSEIFGNAELHGESDTVVTCGQYYPKKNKMIFTIVDVGKTIKENVMEFFDGNVPSDYQNCISWAVQLNNSTKKAQTGGIGLGLLYELYKHNKGKFQIISDDEFWEYMNNKVSTKKLSCKFPGTIVNLEIAQNDDFTYIFNDNSYNFLDKYEHTIDELSDDVCVF